MDTSYKYWRDNIMDERLEYLSSSEKWELCLKWYNKKEDCYVADEKNQ